MAITLTGDSATVSTTEYFIASDSTTATYQTADLVGFFIISTANMAAGDQFTFKAYEKVNGGTAILLDSQTRSGAQTYPVTLGGIPLGEGWEVSITKVSGTDRSFSWSIRTIA